MCIWNFKQAHLYKRLRRRNVHTYPIQTTYGEHIQKGQHNRRLKKMETNTEIELGTRFTRPSSPTWPSGDIFSGPPPSETMDKEVKALAGGVGLARGWLSTLNGYVIQCLM